jgi:hypothetical protein
MKQVFLFSLVILASSSCKEGWSDDYKAQYHTQCLQEAGGMYQTNEQAKAYCDCNLEAVMKVYPHPSDLLENYDSVAIRKALEDCSLKAQQ